MKNFERETVKYFLKYFCKTRTQLDKVLEIAGITKPQDIIDILKECIGGFFNMLECFTIEAEKENTINTFLNMRTFWEGLNEEKVLKNADELNKSGFMDRLINDTYNTEN